LLQSEVAPESDSADSSAPSSICLDCSERLATASSAATFASTKYDETNKSDVKYRKLTADGKKAVLLICLGDWQMHTSVRAHAKREVANLICNKQAKESIS